MSENWIEKRKYIRHPSDIPIEISSQSAPPQEKKSLYNVSFGGLCFRSDAPFENGTIVNVKINYVRPVFEAQGKVVWCSRSGGHFDIGVEFAGEMDAFRSRMVEQVCRIEQYKKEIFEKEGRVVTSTDAALEWIKKYAEKFPKEK